MFADTHPAAFTPGVSWHVQALHDAGFTEADIVGRGGRDAAVAAVK